MHVVWSSSSRTHFFITQTLTWHSNKTTIWFMPSRTFNGKLNVGIWCMHAQQITVQFVCPWFILIKTWSARKNFVWLLRNWADGTRFMLFNCSFVHPQGNRKHAWTTTTKIYEIVTENWRYALSVNIFDVCFIGINLQSCTRSMLQYYVEV